MLIPLTKTKHPGVWTLQMDTFTCEVNKSHIKELQWAVVGYLRTDCDFSVDIGPNVRINELGVFIEFQGQGKLHQGDSDPATLQDLWLKLNDQP
jgi:hypothetical protein